jgi:hypothetical protein
MSFMNYYRAVVLNVLRIVGACFLPAAALILVLALIDVLGGMGWGATWLSVFAGIIFIAIGVLIVWVTTMELKRARGS